MIGFLDIFYLFYVYYTKRCLGNSGLSNISQMVSQYGNRSELLNTALNVIHVSLWTVTHHEDFCTIMVNLYCLQDKLFCLVRPSWPSWLPFHVWVWSMRLLHRILPLAVNLTPVDLVRTLWICTTLMAELIMNRRVAAINLRRSLAG